MTVSTDGIICYGIFVDELPFEDDEGDSIDGEEWWIYYNNWREFGYEKQCELMNENPMPFNMENCCSEDDPSWILCVPDMGNRCSRGYPVEITDKVMSIEGYEEAISKFKKIMSEEFGINEEPKWYLASYWG